MELERELAEVLAPGRVLSRAIDRIAYANDASVYRLVPRLVLQPESIDEVRALFDVSRRHGIPMTFRAAGTSLSGQAVTDGLLVVVSRHWRKVEVEDEGKKVRVQPGVIGGMVNRHLQPFGKKIGPDPASINACMMGGILANNSSGMCCGVVQNAYHTLDSLVFVLPSGLVLDTAAPGAAAELSRAEPELCRGLLALRARIDGDPVLRDKIRRKYGMKNTTGYSLNAFLDYDEPLDILSHLLIGSEGTLGFIAEAVLRTVPDYPLKYTGLLFFGDVPAACEVIGPLRDSGARALELMDRPSLRAIEDQPGVPPLIRNLPATAAALLVEYQCETPAELEAGKRRCDALLPTLSLAAEPMFTLDPERQAALWRVRKGLIPSVGAMRRRGTSFIIEDVVFPVERLARGVAELQALFVKHGYDDAIVFGHAKDGNLHFVLIQAFRDAHDIARYDAFMQDLVQLVVGRHGGALKAEHGTGRNMAPFVAAEWGEDAYRIMRELKDLVDPRGLLNPGVILNDDPRAHVTHLKPLPTVESEVDQCIECGFCEHMCPSRDLTLTPRQRIVVRREMARLKAIDPGSPVLAELEADYGYAALDSCAADGLCALACPVGIDTGRLVKRLRCESHSETGQEVARLLAEHFGLVETLARLALGAGHRVRSILGAGLPGWPKDLPPPASGRLPATARHGAAAVYFPTCVTRVLGADGGGPAESLVEVARRAGRPVWIPAEARGHCCGMPFSSKGYDRAYRAALRRTVDALWSWSDAGRLPVVVDQSPCAHTLKLAGADLPRPARERFEQLEILDGIEYAHDRLLPGLDPRPVEGTVALHPACSVSKMNLEGKLTRLAQACAERADVPLSAGCCGFAGDRGFLLPELTGAALRAEAEEVSKGDYRGYYSTSRTCEIGLSRATGRPYRSIWSLLDEATR